MDARTEAIVERHKDAERARALRDSDREQIRSFIAPDAQSWLGGGTLPEDLRPEILDNSAEQSSEIFANALFSEICAPGKAWVDTRSAGGVEREDRDAALWLAAATRWGLAVCAPQTSGWYTAAAQAIRATIDFGDGCLYVGEGERGRLAINARPGAELTWSEDADGRVDQIFRRYTLDARQAAKAFKADVPEKIAKAAEDRPSERFTFLHAVFVNEEAVPGRRDAPNLPWRSERIWLDEKAPIRASVAGYHESPYNVGRWQRSADSAYGRGCGAVALPDVKMLQRVMRATIRGGEKIVDPPLLAADDGVLGRIQLGSGRITTVRWDMMLRGDPVRALQTGARPDLGEELCASIRQRVEAAYKRHLLQLVRDPNMTATHALLLDAESLRQLAQPVGQLVYEIFAPGWLRLLSIGERAGVLPPRPRSLRGQTLVPWFTSLFMQAVQLRAVSALSRLGDVLAPLVQLQPELLDNLDGDAAFRGSADHLGLPPEWLRPADQVKAIRQGRQQAAEAENAKRDAERAATSAAQLGQAAAMFAQAGQPGRAAA